MRRVTGAFGTLGIALLLCCVVAAQEKSAKQAASSGSDHPPKHQAKLAWKPSSVPGTTAAHRYKIYRASATVNKGKVTCKKDWKVVATTKDATPQYTDEKVKAGEAYCYAVSAVNPHGESRKSEPVTAVIPSP